VLDPVGYLFVPGLAKQLHHPIEGEIRAADALVCRVQVTGTRWIVSNALSRQPPRDGERVGRLAPPPPLLDLQKVQVVPAMIKTVTTTVTLTITVREIRNATSNSMPTSSRGLELNRNDDFPFAHSRWLPRFA